MKHHVTDRTITVTWSTDGYHRWPDAPPPRNYLEARHRHRFGMSVTIPVDHDDRAVEFHDLLDFAAALFPAGTDFGTRSCEAIAAEIAGHVLERFPPAWVAVTVNEDGYVAGTVRCERVERTDR